MSWRLARSLETLRDEAQERWPGTTVWTVGDQDHAARASDHNPNDAGVVCAIDIVGREQAQALWDELLASPDPRVKYAIFDRRIVNSTVSPWQVRDYGGSNPHTTHIHVSVGRGPDGGSYRSDLYDDAAPWLDEEDDMPTPDEFVDALMDRKVRGGGNVETRLYYAHTHARAANQRCQALVDTVEDLAGSLQALADGDSSGARQSALNAGEVARQVRAELADALEADDE